MKGENDGVLSLATPASVSFSSRSPHLHNTLTLQLWRIVQARLQSWRPRNQKAAPCPYNLPHSIATSTVKRVQLAAGRCQQEPVERKELWVS